jgi:hypothetical protein
MQKRLLFILRGAYESKVAVKLLPAIAFQPGT